MHIFISLALIFFISSYAQSAELWKSEKPIANFHLKAKYQSNEDGVISISAAPGAAVSFPVKQGTQGIIEIGASQKEGERGKIKGWINRKPLAEIKEYGEAGKATNGGNEGKHLFVSSPKQSKDPFDMGKDFTAYVKFKAKGDGTLLSKAIPGEKWLKNGKALYIREGRLIYDIGWKGMITGANKVNDGKWHEAALVTRSGKTSLYLDGKKISEKKSFSATDPARALFQIGTCTADFGGDLKGTVSNLRYWKRGLEEKESLLAVSNRVDETNTPDFNWSPVNSTQSKQTVQEGKPSLIDGFVAWHASITASNDQIKISEVTVSELGDADHSQIVSAWDHNSLDRGARIYNGLCITCHGTDKVEGTLPTALRFHKGEFKNGKDLVSMYSTLTKGFNQMVAQPWMTPQQKWDVIHYIRETFIRKKNPSQFVNVDEAYVNSLPRGLDLGPQSPKLFGSGEPKWKKMNYGPVQFWTIQVGSGNIAYKGIAVRLDEGPGGIAQGNKWILYDHDTMRIASAWEGNKYIDWRG
ncbi:MAG: LamG-like jellyroll fold domain-containing protein, partial [Verrucomicrobiota bacterium]|nr:LamG-like jellyroll fold domain-containing protein [Verrucomicrobiota bacterium]